MHGDDLLPSPYLTLVEGNVIIDVSGTSVDNIFGIAWNGEFDCEHTAINSRSVLLVHHTITPEEVPFFLKDTALSYKELMSKFPKFRYIVCGDYHVPHIHRMDNRILVNCGSLTRSNKDQFNYHPNIYFLDTDAIAVKLLPVPIKPPEEVFKIPEEVKEPVDEVLLAEHIDAIVKANGSTRPDFISTVNIIMKGEQFNANQRDLARRYYDKVRKS